MDNRVKKIVAKYNALFYAATVLDNHAKAFDLKDDDLDLPDEFYEQVDIELNRIVKSLHNRAEKLAEQHSSVPNLVQMLLAEI